MQQLVPAETKVNERKHWQFQPGNTLGGRTVGARNKYGEKVFEDFYAHWQQHGAAAIEQLRAESVRDYVRAALMIVPKELHISAQGVGDMSDDDVLRIIDAVRTIVMEQGLVIEHDSSSEQQQNTI